MKFTSRLFVALFALHLQAHAEPSAEYEFYRVRSGESVETIAGSRGLKPELLRQLNPALEHVVFPEEGTVIFVPPQNRPAPRRNLSSRSGRLQAHPTAALAAAAPVAAPNRVPPSAARRAFGDGLSDTEVEMIFEQVARRHTGPVADAMELALPATQNVMITSDGRSISVPSAAPRKPKPREDERPGSVSLSPRGEKVLRLLKSSMRYMGVPYVWGGEDASGMDCSGFVQKVFTDHGVRMPRTADLQFEVGQVVGSGNEQPGDLVFFETYCPGASHVGIYLGKHQFVHASSGAGYITIGDLRDEYFSRCYLGARRNW